MTVVILAQFLALIALLVFSAFFSSSETAFFSLNPLQIHKLVETHPRPGSLVQRILEMPRSLLSTILIGNTVVNVAAAATGFALAEQLYPRYAEELSIVAVTLLLLIFGEVGPKRIAMFWPERVAMVYAPVLMFFMRVLAPFRTGLEWITNRLEPFFTGRSPP